MCSAEHAYISWLGISCVVVVASGTAADSPLRRSDVVFMYQADRQTYQQYGATVLAWGGKPTPQSKAEARRPE